MEKGRDYPRARLSSASHKFEAKVEPLGLHHERCWWDEQKDADGKFQAALRAAGMVEGVNTEHQGSSPRTLPREITAIIRSSAGNCADF
jgi:hypothetical protein